MSIKPKFAFAILRGDKRFEFRRILYKSEAVRRVVLYASSPVSKVIGEFNVAAVHSMKPSDLWQLTQEQAGINRSYFEKYFADRDVGHALEVSEPFQYETPVELTALGVKSAPQSFCYLEEPVF